MRSRSTSPDRIRSQAGVTLIELLLAIAITTLIVVPLGSWTVSTMRQQDSVRDVLSNAVSTGKLTAAFSRDVASARTVAPTGGDCFGGPGASGTVKLALVAGGLDQTRIVYSEARPDGAPPTSPERSLWRRECSADGTLSIASEVFDKILPGSTALSCPSATTPVPTVAAACAEEANRRVALAVTPAGPSTSPKPVAIQATRRANAGSIGVPGSGNRPPIAQIEVSDAVGYVNEPFTFSASKSEDLDGTIQSYDWEFPNSSGGTDELSGEVVDYAFDAVGEQTVLLRVTDDQTASNIAAVTVRVVNRYPVASISFSPETGLRGIDEFTFDATGSFDPDDPAEVLDYQWDLGPGLGADQFKSGQVVNFTFPADAPKGQRQITLTVTDSLGGTDVKVRAISLVDELPDTTGIIIVPAPVLTEGKSPRVGSVGPGLPPLAVTFVPPFGATPEAGTTWRLRRVGGATSLGTGSAETFAWSFGSDGQGEYEIARLDAVGQLIGTPLVFRVNAAPTATFTVFAGATGAPRTVDFTSAGSADPDGSIVAWNWDFGFFGNWTSTNANPTHVFTEPGQYTVRLTVIDDDGAATSTEQLIDVTGPVPPPPPPTWDGDRIAFAAVPGAAMYRVTITCDGTPAPLPDPQVVPSAAPGFDLPPDTCPPPAVAAATLEVRKSTVWSPPSATGTRP